MKARWISLGVGIGLALALTLGFALAGSGPDPGPSNNAQASDMWAACDAMHDSPAMEQLRAQMPEQMRTQCDAMHEQMGQMMESGAAGMMGGGMEGGPGMMGGPSTSHHVGGMMGG